MLPAGNHVHSQFSWDTGPNASMADTCRRAVEVGRPAIAFTEHVDVDGYLASIEAGEPHHFWRR
jgi:histidinol-phosphatase (PHP family)